MIKILFILLMLVGSIFAKTADDINNLKNIPKNFWEYKDTLNESVSKYTEDIQTENFRSVQYVTYFGSLIEHESCITLTNPRCWSPKSELLTRWSKTNKVREQGVGLGQITRAYSESGIIRLDVLTDLRKRYPKQLKDLTWDNIKDRADLQIVAITLLWLDNYDRVPKSVPELDRIAFADSAYNGGYGFIIKDRKSCGLKANCDPNLWFNNVEKMNNRGNKILYGTRTANDINRHHVRDVLLDKWTKYYSVDWD